MRLYDLDKILVKLENRRLELNHLRKTLKKDGLDSPYMDGQINENAKVTEMLTELLKESMEAVRVTNVRTVPQREMRDIDGMFESVIKDRMDHEIRSEASDILRICRKYGYGNVMEWASALWRYEERMKGNPTAGCFVPTCPDFIKAKFKHSDITYDKLVASVMEGHACR